VVKIEDLGLDCPVVCQACKERYCTGCPEEAIHIGLFGEVMVDQKACTGCGICERLCPVGAIELYEEAPLVCDLCGGDPTCVKACTMGAISFDPQAKEIVSLREYEEGSGSSSPEEKRVQFALRSFGDLRRSWIPARRG
jgi:Fe-S-cluster-containing hydrogenase component 2